MALPKLNDSPKYELVIPSSNQKVRYRPYLVKGRKSANDGNGVARYECGSSGCS
jgi:hypothetical protein